MLTRIRSSLTLKMLAGNLLIVVVGVITLALAVALLGPPLFEDNIHALHHGLQEELSEAFRDTVIKALLIAAAAAIVAALAVSVLVTSRVVAPLRRLDAAAQRIAAGRYDERVALSDPDEVGRLAATFNEMAASLEAGEQRRRQLVGDVAHELRTPLSTVEAYLEAIEDGVTEPSPSTIALLRSETGRLGRLVDDLEQVSRAEARQLPLEIRSIDPAALVARAVEQAQREFDAKGVQLEIDPADEQLPQVKADPDRLTQVLANLLSNALRHTPAGGSVHIGAGTADQTAEFTVRDSGEGIAAEHLPHVFERFYRADPSRSRSGGGSGIGLTVAKALVEAHGGTIAAASAGAGRGATFTFGLPVA